MSRFTELKITECKKLCEYSYTYDLPKDNTDRDTSVNAEIKVFSFAFGGVPRDFKCKYLKQRMIEKHDLLKEIK